MKIHVDPNFLNIYGQLFNLAGGLFLAIDAIGALDFLEHLEKKEDIVQSRMASISYTATINTVFTNISVCVIGFTIIYHFLSTDKLIIALVIAPFTFPSLRLMAHLAQKTYDAIIIISPNKYITYKGCLNSLIYLFVVIVWLIFVGISFVLFISLKFLVEIPLLFIGEKIIAPLLLRILRSTANLQTAEKRFHFRKNAFLGLLLVIIGFSYQLIASILQLSLK